MGGLQRSSAAVENWLALQQHVEGFSLSARRVARRLAHFVGMLNQEEVVSPTGGAEVQALKDAAHRNRGSYRKLRKELEELTDHGLLMLKSLQRPDANVMQRLAVQVLCKQLDQAWTYFNRSWKMQDHVYVQYLELNTFQIRFREVVNAFAEDLARLERDVPTGGFSSEDEVNDAVDKLDSLSQTAIAADVARATELEQGSWSIQIGFVTTDFREQYMWTVGGTLKRIKFSSPVPLTTFLPNLERVYVMMNSCRRGFVIILCKLRTS